MSEKDRLCNVCIDEMSLKCGLHYNVSKDRIDGFVNMDCGGSQEISKQALVFMATGLVSNWKQPIGFFLVKTTASAHVLKTLLSECLTRLFDIGLCVKSVIFDQGASNQKLVKLLDVTVETPFFCHGDNKVFVLFDPPHLLKSVRNNLKNHDFLLDDKVISWKYIEKVYEIESSKPNMLRLAPSLTKQHIELPAFSKMKVKRAAQIFSNTVQAAMMTYICSGHLPQEAYHTAAFVKNMDSLFDIFNSTGLHDVKMYKRALVENSPSFDYLYMMADIFKRVKIQGSRGATPCITGWQVSISAVISLWDEVKSVCGVKYLCTRKLNQDPLDNCFSFTRAKGGFCANPDPKQFADAYKQVLIKSCISQSELSNCESDTNSLLLEVFGTQSKQCANDTAVIATDDSLGITELAAIGVNSLPQQNALFYVGGYICKKYLAKHSCKECTSSLTCSELSELSDSSTTFLQHKSYKSVSSGESGLTIPSGAFVSFLKKCEDVFVSYFLGTMHMTKVCQRMVSVILAVADLTFLPAGECRDNFTVAVRFYVKMRVFYAVKFFNTSLAERPRIKRNRKALILEHL